MAPEFFPFIAFGILVFVIVGGLGVAALLFALTWYLRRRGAAPWAKRLAAALGCATVAGVVVISVGLVFLGGKIRQQYFLNEPLVTACAGGDMARAQELLSRGASPDAYGIDFINTALIAASSAGHKDIVALLLRRGADPDLKDSFGETAAERARQNGHIEIARMLEDAQKHPPKT